MSKCTIAECLSPVYARGYCRKHYKKFMRYGDPLAGIFLVKHGELCSVEGCSRKHLSQGYCGMHYGRWVDSRVSECDVFADVRGCSAIKAL